MCEDKTPRYAYVLCAFPANRRFSSLHFILTPNSHATVIVPLSFSIAVLVAVPDFAGTGHHADSGSTEMILVTLGAKHLANLKTLSNIVFAHRRMASGAIISHGWAPGPVCLRPHVTSVWCRASALSRCFCNYWPEHNFFRAAMPLLLITPEILILPRSLQRVGVTLEACSNCLSYTTGLLWLFLAPEMGRLESDYQQQKQEIDDLRNRRTINGTLEIEKRTSTCPAKLEKDCLLSTQ